MDDILHYIRDIASSSDSRQKRVESVAAAIKARGQYRWVGIYDVSPSQVSVIAWSGPGAPAYPTFPITQGLTSAAIKQRSTVVANDVTKDARYLTAFGNTRSEIIVPVLSPSDGQVIGTIDVESELENAFSPKDQRVLEQCAIAALPLWTGTSTRMETHAAL
jgi:L-methionine (R)-S-oxide reductase